MFKDAYFSEYMTYRFNLVHNHDEDKPKIMYIMIRPSTADVKNDDNTTRKLIKYTKLWGYGGFTLTNLYPDVCANIKDLKKTKCPVRKYNKNHIQNLIKNEKYDKVIYAWGTTEKEPRWLYELVNNPSCFAISVKGFPKNPLYLKNDLHPILYVRNHI